MGAGRPLQIIPVQGIWRIRQTLKRRVLPRPARPQRYGQAGGIGLCLASFRRCFGRPSPICRYKETMKRLFGLLVSALALVPAQVLANQSANQDLGDGRVMTHKGAVVLVVTKQGAYQYCYVNPIAPVLAEGRLNIDCTDDKPLGLGGFEHRLRPPSP